MRNCRTDAAKRGQCRPQATKPRIPGWRGDYAGCRQLWAAVLALAIEDLGAGNILVRTSAKQYILSDDAAIGGFLFCCQILDLDIETTRRLALDPEAAGRLKLSAKLRSVEQRSGGESDEG